MKPGSRWVYRETDARARASRSSSRSPTRRRGSPTGSRPGRPRRGHRGRRARRGHRRLVRAGRRTGTSGTSARTRPSTRTASSSRRRARSRPEWTAPSRASSCPRKPEAGLTYRQEYYKGEAEDQGAIVSLDEQAEVPVGPLQAGPDDQGHRTRSSRGERVKFYARGVGPVLAVAISGGATARSC